MKKVYVYRDGEMVLKSEVVSPQERFHDVVPDLDDFVSVVDRTIVNGRAGLREHNRRNGVTNPADFTNHWANFQKKREALFTGKDNSKSRTEAIVRAFHHLQGRDW